ncbi:large ribosomal subunit protein uL16m-like isoform X2 [Lasioglossum baleicum]|uniref:large ribosomal subunit protein uL16m-like isoform X2 n=1 Tax=Lasioglossum baleicum TaxID=434251 RepID=UPI003FCE1AEF
MMQTGGTIMKALLSRPLLKQLMNQRIAGIKSYPVPAVFKDIETPERKRLRVVSRNPQYPPGVRVFTMQKKLRLMRGPELYHNTLLYKQYGIVARGGGRLKYNHFEMIRYGLLRTVFPQQKDAFAIWRVQDPWQPISKKGQGMRMGGGKAGIDHYATPVRSGQIVVEVGGPFEYFEVKKYLRNIANRLPFAAEAVSYQKMLLQDRQKKKVEEENLNPWTWKYIIQNKMLGNQNWISKYDKKWYMEYL